MIKDNQILVLLIVDKSNETQLLQAVNKVMSNTCCRVLPKPICDGSNVLYPAATIDALFRALVENEGRRYVLLLQQSYLQNIPTILTVIQKYENEYDAECEKGKRLLTRRIAITDCQWTGDFDLGHDFVFGKREDMKAILLDKQTGKHSISNNA